MAGGSAPAEARTEQARHGCVGCLVEAAPYGARKAKRLSSALKRKESCHCCPGVEGVGRPASPVSGCRLKCDGEVGLAIACLTEGAGVVFVRAEEAEAEAVVVAVEQSLVACWMKASRPGRSFLSSHSGEAILADAPGLHCGRILAVPPLGVRASGTRRKAFGLATRACLPPVPYCRRSSFVCCTANLGHHPVLSVLPCAERCPVAWRKHRDVRGCRGLAQGSGCGWINRCSTDDTWSSLPARIDTSLPLRRTRLRSGTCAHTCPACSSP
jgi:hypothetical protein